MQHPSTSATGPRDPRSLWVALAFGLVLLSSHEVSAQEPSSPPAEGQARRPPDALNFANGLYRDRRYDLAAEEYEKFLKTAPPGPDADDARYGLANAQLFLGKYKDARRTFEQFVEAAPKHPNAPTALYRVGETAYLLGDLPAAQKALEGFTSANPGHRHVETAWSHLGDVYLRSGDLPKAKVAYQTVLKTAKGTTLAHRASLGLGRVLASLGETDASLATLADLAQSGGPEWVDKAWFEAGRVNLSAERFDKAVAAFEAMEKASTKSNLVAESRLLRAEALARLDRRDEAEALLTPLAASPSPAVAAPAADALGVSLLARGKAEEALKQFDEAYGRFGKTSTGPVLAFHGGETAQRLGKADARSRFLKLAETYPTDPLAEAAVLRAATLALDARDYAASKELAAGFPARFPRSPLRADARLIEGRTALGEGDAKGAIRILDDVLTQGKPVPRTAQAVRYYLGLAYRADGQADKATEVLGVLAKTTDAAASVDAQFLLGQGHVEAGRFAEAIPALEAYLESKPKGEVADFALAHVVHAQLELGRADAATKTLADLAARFPKSKALPTTRLRVAEAALAAKEFDRAAEQFSLASETDDVAVKARALSGLGWSRLQGGKPAESAAAFADLLKAAPEDPLAVDAALARGRALERAKKADEAIAAYAIVAEKYPKSEAAGPALVAQGRLLVEAKRPADAATAFEKVAKDYPKASGEPLDTVLAEWGWSLVDAGKTEDADKVFTRLLAEFPDSPKASDARFNLAESSFAARKFDPIAGWLAPVVAPGSKASPTLVQSSLYRLGRTQIERKEWADAAKTLARLVEEFPSGPYRREARFWKAEVAFQSGDPKAAESEFDALGKEPSAPSDPPGLLAAARRRRVQSLIQLDRWADALAAADAFRAEFPKDPQLPEVVYAKGRALQGLARFDESRAAYDEVIEARKGADLAARAQFMKGESLFHQKTYREALKEFLKVDYLYDAPIWQASALLEAGKVHEQLSQWAEAAETYERLRAKFPADSNAAKAQARLDAVRKRIASAPGPTDRADTGR